MILLVLSVILCLVSAAVEDPSDLQLFRYNAEYKLLSSLLAKECPEYTQQKRELTDLQKLNLELKASLVQHLKEQLLKCRQDKLVSTTGSTTHVTDPDALCPSYDGDSIFNMKLISYNNPTNKKASGVLCKPDGSPCSISLEICVSPINSTSCEFYRHLTNVVEDNSKIDLTKNLGDLKNPVEINLGNRKWQGALVRLTMWGRNPTNSLTAYHLVDEFSYELADVQGSPGKLVTLHGIRATDKTELVVMFTVPCPSPSTTELTTPSTTHPTTPSTTHPTTPATTQPTTPSTTHPTTPSTTLPTTPSTTLPITPSTTLPTTPSTMIPTTPSTTLPTTATSPPRVPAECITATNLTSSWRRDHGGKRIRGSGPHSAGGPACDKWDMGWFRFTGSAGTHMLDTCPAFRSCGTTYSRWTDDTPPKDVGVPAKISSYSVAFGKCKSGSRPMLVMRCSLNTEHDLIYKLLGPYITGTSICDSAFCGMK